MATQNPNLMSKAAMTTMASTSGSGKLLMHEVLTKVNNAKDKPKKIAVLKENDSPHLRMILKKMSSHRKFFLSIIIWMALLPLVKIINHYFVNVVLCL